MSHRGSRLDLLVVFIMLLAGAGAAEAETLLYSGGDWDFEANPFIGEIHMLAGECSNPPVGGHQSCVPDPHQLAYLGPGWHHWADFPPPDWTGPPVNWYTPGHWGVANFNQNKNLANVSRGTYSQEITLTCANGVGMIYRQATVPDNHRLRIEADAKWTQSEPYGPNVEAFLGLDPTGGINPEAATVQWWPWDGTAPLMFHRTREEIDTTGTTLTIFIMMLHREPPCAGGTFMIDNVEVYDLGALGPRIERAPSTLTPEVLVSHDAASDEFTVWNGGADTLNYTISETASWLEVVLTSGSVTTGTATHTINYSTSGLAAGQYTESLVISSPDASNSPQSISVVLQVTTKPGDFDGDGDVDQHDFGVFQICITGSDAGPFDAGCEPGNFDSDLDIDSSDLSRFLSCISGATIPSDPNCGQ